MRVLITGAAGFIGSHLARHQAAAGHQVVALDRPDAPTTRLDDLRGRVRLVPVDLADAAAARRLLDAERPEVLFHLAWYADPRDYLTAPANRDSLEMTSSVVKAAIDAGCRQLVIGGTCLEYAPAAAGVAPRPLREDDPVDPQSLYASCKYTAWLSARALAAEAGVKLAWGRIFHLHGPDESPQRLIPWVAGELGRGVAVELTDGTQVRDHLHVADVAAGLAALAARETEGITNICSGTPVTLRHVLETVGELAGRSGLLKFGARPHRAGENMYLAGDNTRLRSLGFTPRFSLRDGLSDALRGRI